MAYNQFNPAYAQPYTPQQGGAPMTATPMPQSSFGSNRFNNLGGFMNQVPQMYQNAMQPYQTSPGQFAGDVIGGYQQFQQALGDPNQAAQSAFNSYKSMLSGMGGAMADAQRQYYETDQARTQWGQQQTAVNYAQDRLGTGFTPEQQSAYLRAVGEKYGNQTGSLQGPAMAGYMTKDFALADMAQQQQNYQNYLNAINYQPNTTFGQMAGQGYLAGAGATLNQQLSNALTPQNMLGLAGQYAALGQQNRMAPWNQAMGMMGQGNVYGGGGGTGNENLVAGGPTWGPQGNPTSAAMQLYNLNAANQGLGARFMGDGRG